MQTENVSTLKIHKLTKAQYDREKEAGNLDETALYLTPDEEIDLSSYATTDEVNEALASSKTYTNEQIAAIPTPDVSGQISTHNTSTTAHTDIRNLISTHTENADIHVTADDKVTWNGKQDAIAATGLLKGTTDGIVAAIAGTDYATGVHQHTTTDITDFPTSLPASDVYAWAKAETKPTYTAAEVGADASGSADNALAEAKAYTDVHNTSNTAHSDIRSLISDLTDRLNAVADSDDTTLDQLSEIVAYIKSNKDLIDAITTSKVSVDDIVNDLTTNVSTKVLSAAQGVVIKSLIDTLTTEVNKKQAIITGAATTIADADLTASKVLVSDESGKVAVSDISITELEYLSGTTSNVQSQLDTKMDKVNPTGTGSFSLNRQENSAVGSFSVAEGSNTIASGDYSHAEGYYTTASTQYQHVQGKFNVEDSAGTYQHIVGNGAKSDSRSNAHTLDWDGNAWFAGDVYVGSTSGTNRDEGSVKLLTANDLTLVDLSNVSVGDTFTYGKYQVESEDPWAVEWEVVDDTDPDYIIAQTKAIIDLRCFDAIESSNTDSDRASEGNNNWRYSNIKQFLNSDQENWYSSQHTYDAPPNSSNVWNNYNPYDTHKGFLYYFSDIEKTYLQDMTLTLANPSVDGGGSYTWTGKVWLPTYTQMGYGTNNSISEGTQFSKYTDNSSRIKYLHEKCAENNSYAKAQGYTSSKALWYWMSSADPSDSYYAWNVHSGGYGHISRAYDGDGGLAPCIKLPRKALNVIDLSSYSFITTDDIDEICGATIVNAAELTY